MSAQARCDQVRGARPEAGEGGKSGSTDTPEMVGGKPHGQAGDLDNSQINHVNGGMPDTDASCGWSRNRLL